MRGTAAHRACLPLAGVILRETAEAQETGMDKAEGGTSSWWNAKGLKQQKQSCIQHQVIP